MQRPLAEQALLGSGVHTIPIGDGEPLYPGRLIRELLAELLGMPAFDLERLGIAQADGSAR